MENSVFFSSAAAGYHVQLEDRPHNSGDHTGGLQRPVHTHRAEQRHVDNPRERTLLRADDAPLRRLVSSWRGVYPVLPQPRRGPRGA